jgi:hypothetical protein
VGDAGVCLEGGGWVEQDGEGVFLLLFGGGVGCKGLEEDLEVGVLVC